MPCRNVQHRVQPLQPVSIKRLMSLLRIQIVKACSVLAYLLAVYSLPSLAVCYSILINADVTRPLNVSIGIKEHCSPDVVYQAALDRLVRPALS